MTVNLHQFGKVVLVAALVGVSSASAFGQTTRPDGGGYRPSGYPESYRGSFYPAVELQALPPARAAAVAAKTDFQTAQSTLNNSIADAHRRADRSPTVLEALAEEKAAWEALKAARQQALADLKNDSSYQANAELRDRLAEQIEQLRKQPDATPEQVLALATVKLSYAKATSAMENDAIAADEKSQAARQRLVAASSHVAALKQQIDDAVHDDLDIRAARKAVAEAKTAALAADALYIEARNVARVALDYAYDQLYTPRPYSIYQPYSTYGYYPSAYPIGYPIAHPHGHR